MRRSEGLTSPRGLAAAAVLAVAAVAGGWLCLRTATIEALSPTGGDVGSFASDDPGAVLATETAALVRHHGMLSPAARARVAAAAAAAPLDARPYVILGHQQLLDRQPARALRIFEAGQRLDPRDTLLQILLLDTYLKAGRFRDAATQMALVARLAGPTQPAVASAMAAMVVNPQTRSAVRRALDTDPSLENAVLTAMARSDVAPAAIFAFASPAARQRAAATDGWGQALVARLVERGGFAPARAVWARVNRLPPAAGIVNPRFAAANPPPPFGWTLIAGSIGAADLRNGALAVDYYGRESGDLATQLLVLGPGRYRFSFTVDAGKTDAGAKLFWSVTCAVGAKATLADVAVTAGASPRRLAAAVVVPAGCPAQRLTLRGEAGDLPTATGATIRDLDLRALPQDQP